MSKRSEKRGTVKINITDILIVLLAVFCALGIIFHKAAESKIDKLAKEDVAVVSFKTTKTDDDCKKYLFEGTILYFEGDLSGKIISGPKFEDSYEYIINEEDVKTLAASGAVDVKATFETEGKFTSEGFLLPNGKYLRANEKVILKTKGFEFEGIITSVENVDEQ